MKLILNQGYKCNCLKLIFRSFSCLREILENVLFCTKYKCQGLYGIIQFANNFLSSLIILILELCCVRKHSLTWKIPHYPDYFRWHLNLVQKRNRIISWYLYGLQQQNINWIKFNHFLKKSINGEGGEKLSLGFTFQNMTLHQYLSIDTNFFVVFNGFL